MLRLLITVISFSLGMAWSPPFAHKADACSGSGDPPAIPACYEGKATVFGVMHAHCSNKEIRELYLERTSN